MRPSSPPGTPKHGAGPGPSSAFGSPFESSIADEERAASPEAWGLNKAGEVAAGGESQSTAAAPPAVDAAATGPPAHSSGLSIRTSGSRHHYAASADLGLPPVPPTAGSLGRRGSGAAPAPAPTDVWGWLQPGRSGLPHVLLQGRGVAIGRGREAYEERLPLLLLASPPGTPSAGGGSSGGSARRLNSADGLETGSRGRTTASAAAAAAATSGRRQKASAFIEVADGRVSRLHCWVKRGPDGEALLEDCSSNGTFLNGAKVPRGACVPLRDGDRVSLVLSVAPLAEQFFVYHGGDPRAQDPEAVAGWIEAASKAWAASPSGTPYCGSPAGSPRRAAAASRASLARSKTSKYATADAVGLDDLQCQICLGTLRACVALEPCGHNFCAACLSHHFAALLGSGQPLACPLRCSPPERVVANREVRRLVWARTQSMRRRQQQHQQEAGEAAGPSSGAAAAAAAVGGAAWLDTLHEGASSAGGSACESPPSSPALPAAAQGPGSTGPEQQQQQGQPGSTPAEAAPAAAPSSDVGGAPGASEGPPREAVAAPAGDEPPAPAAISIEVTAVSGGGGADVPSPSSSVWAQLQAEAEAGPGEEAEEGEELGMNPVCPLHDELLPLDASGLKRRQLGYSVELLQQAETPSEAMGALEALARLGWSDDAVRGEIAALGGIESAIACMQEWAEDDGVQCNGCLALMALVRGEGEVSDANKWRVARAEGVETIVAALRTHRQQAMVQLSALLCIVPLALENSYLQGRIADLALPDILQAIRQHSEELEVVGKALVALGVLGQGDEKVHEGIRERIVASGAPRAIAEVLSTLGCVSEEVLWAGLFALAVVVRESSRRYVEHMLALAAAGVLPALRAAMAAYKAEVEALGGEADEMIIKAGDFLIESLSRAEQLLWLRRKRRAYLALALAATAVLGYRAIRRLRPSWRRARAAPLQ